MPHLWALMRRTFNLRAFLGHGSASRSRHGTRSRSETLPHTGSAPITDDRKWYGLKNKDVHPDSFLGPGESEEHITGVPLEIRKDVEFRVEHQHVGPDLDHDLEYGTTADRLGPPGLHTGWQSKTTIDSSLGPT
jgi:hypothetical protein